MHHSVAENGGFFLLVLCIVGGVVSSQGNKLKMLDIPEIGSVAVLYEAQLITGEGPFWKEDEQVLHFVDIPGRSIFRHDPATEITTKATYDEGVSISFVIPVAGQEGTFMIGMGQSVGTIEWDGQDGTALNFTPLTNVEEQAGNRFNDGKCDRNGRLWTGTMGYFNENGQISMNSSNLYRLDSDSLEVQVEYVTLSNGMAWSSDDKLFYYIDTWSLRVDVFDYDIDSATISNRRTLFDLVENGFEGSPDGMTIDVDGNLWVALYNGNGVVKVNGVTGAPEGFIRLPVPKATSCAWGGADLDVLYVSTAAEGADLSEFPLSGSMFKVNGLSTRGFPSVPVQIDIL
ncbi:unnamed protein product [Notodromas monacha]|uniref:Regucalcin n=1 Tax=Notodromas monacha TaxID=399045 RepID=A0A7R9BFP1_9CRUS|nr:unnamed protein product [Notodromas monacha]CAG0913320.1 unnamed protein product [Notodromas monacha]